MSLPQQRFFQRRLQNLLGDSELDDATTKVFMQMIEQQMDILMKATEPKEIYYAQGYVAALRGAIEEVRRNNRKNIVNDDEED